MISQKALIITLKDNDEYQPLLQGKPQTCGMRSGRVYLPPDEACGWHSTDDHEEMLVFLSGQGQALVGEEETPHPVGEGKVLYVPPHTVHNIKNNVSEPLVYIYCVAPVK